MIVEIRKAGFLNKGAELMLVAAITKLRERYPNVKITMAPIYGGVENTFEKMSELGIYPKAWLWKKGMDLGFCAHFIPERLRRLYGIVVNDEVDVVLDAAGFAYGDQWGGTFSRELAQSSARWRKNGTKLILLPQAFGPYGKEDVARYSKNWVKNADLIFARECESYKHLTQLVGERRNIMVYPDFTNIVRGTLPPGYDVNAHNIAIVPNCRMIDKTTRQERDAYLPFLIRCVSHLIRRKQRPFVLIHEGEGDRILAESLSTEVGGLPIIKELDPLHIKGILGSCDATVGSRFHGLVSALSQGVPSLATGWSHKYKCLFDDYGFPEGMVSVVEDDLVLRRKLDMLIDPQESEILRNKLLTKSSMLQRRTEEMWTHIFTKLDPIAYETKIRS